MKRTIAFDLARGIAMVGVFAAHLAPATAAFAHGRSLALLILVSGIVAALADTGGDPLRAHTKVIARAGLYFALGALLIALRSPATIILPYFSLTLLAAIPFFGWSRRGLFVFAIISMLTLPAVSHLVRYAFEAEGPGEKGFPNLYQLVFSGYYPVYALLPLFLLGFSLGDRVLDPRFRQRRLLPLGILFVVLGYGGAWTLQNKFAYRKQLEFAYENSEVRVEEEKLSGPLTLDQFIALEDGVVPAEDWAWQTIAAPHSGTAFELMGSAGVALLALLACFACARLRFAQVFSALGTCSLSAYIVHILFVWTVARFFPTYAKIPFESWTQFLGFSFAMLAASVWMRRRWGMGPVEVLTRKISAHAAY